MAGAQPNSLFLGPNAADLTGVGVPAKLPPFKPTPESTKGVNGIAKALNNNSFSVADNVATPYAFSFIFSPTSIPAVDTNIYINSKNVGAALDYSVDFNSDGTISFFVTDSAGSAEISTALSLETGWTYALAFYYLYDGSIAGNKSDFMKISVNGRITSTSVISDTAAAGLFLSTQASTLTCTCTSSFYMASISQWWYSWWNSSWWWYSWFYWYYWWYYWSYYYYYWYEWYWWWWWASISSDPHFYGFEGEIYDFQGTVGDCYNLISDKDLQMNARFGFWYKYTGGFGSGGIDLTIMESIGVKFSRNILEINTNGRILFNGVELDGKTYFNEDDYVGSISIIKDIDTSTVYDFGRFIKGVSVETKAYKFVIAICTDNIHRPYLNVLATLKDTTRRPHGIIGQTADGDGKPRIPIQYAKQAEGVIEGNYKDYRVSDLWSNDFKFNKFCE